MRPAHRHLHASGLAGSLLQRSSDVRLAALIAAGRDAAYTELVRRHQPPLRAYAQQILADRHSADDVVADVLDQAVKALRDGEKMSDPGQWLLDRVHLSVLDGLDRQATADHDAGDPADGVAPAFFGPGSGALAAILDGLKRTARPQRARVLSEQLTQRTPEQALSELNISKAPGGSPLVALTPAGLLGGMLARQAARPVKIDAAGKPADAEPKPSRFAESLPVLAGVGAKFAALPAAARAGVLAGVLAAAVGGYVLTSGSGSGTPAAAPTVLNPTPSGNRYNPTAPTRARMYARPSSPAASTASPVAVPSSSPAASTSPFASPTAAVGADPDIDPRLIQPGEDVKKTEQQTSDAPPAKTPAATTPADKQKAARTAAAAQLAAAKKAAAKRAAAKNAAAARAQKKAAAKQAAASITATGTVSAVQVSAGRMTLTTSSTKAVRLRATPKLLAAANNCKIAQVRYRSQHRGGQTVLLADKITCIKQAAAPTLTATGTVVDWANTDLTLRASGKTLKFALDETMLDGVDGCKTAKVTWAKTSDARPKLRTFRCLTRAVVVTPKTTVSPKTTTVTP